MRMESGSIFADRYRVVRRIATGGMGAVYEVTHMTTDRHFALKVMLPEFAEEAGLRERFQHEARVTARVESEHIVDTLDAGLDAVTGNLYLVMELLRGEDLGERVKKLGRLNPADVITYLRQAASALDKTHAALIVHRDLKPENLFLTWREDGTPRLKVLDFGIAKILAESTSAKRRSAVLGTPLYMAPEQFGGIVPSPGTDVYALGLIAYTLLVGAPYWDDEATIVDNNPFAFALKASMGPIESAVARAARRGVQLPQAFASWFAKATHREAAQRFSMASECITELAQLLTAPNTSVANGSNSNTATSNTATSHAKMPNTPAVAARQITEPLATDAHPFLGANARRPLDVTTTTPVSDGGGTIKESSAHSLSVSSVPPGAARTPARWRLWAAAGAAAVFGAAALLWLQQDRERVAAVPTGDAVPTGNAELATDTAPTAKLGGDSPGATVIVDSARRPEPSDLGVHLGLPSTVGSSTPLPNTSSASASSKLDTGAAAPSASRANVAPRPPVATTRAGSTAVVAPPASAAVPVAPKQYCFEHPDSGRVIPYITGAALRGQETFACYRTPNGQYLRKK
jgi:serine/threonine-protein kinase